MIERTPKLECTWKIEQDRSFLKILTFGQDLCKSQFSENWTFAQFPSFKWRNKSQKTKWDIPILKILTFGQDSCKSQLFRNWTVCTISISRMKKWIPKSECTRKTEWDRPILKILTFWSKSKFKLGQSFLFFNFRQFGLGQDEQVNLGRPGSNRGSGRCRYPWRHSTGWCVPAHGRLPARVRAWMKMEARGKVCSMRQRFLDILEVRGCTLQPFWSRNFWAL